MYIYYCQNCKEFDAFNSEDGKYNCPICGRSYLSLGVQSDEWNNYSNEEMLELIEHKRRSAGIKKPIFDGEVDHYQSSKCKPASNSYNENTHFEIKGSYRIVAIVAVAMISVLIVISVLKDRVILIEKNDSNDYSGLSEEVNSVNDNDNDEITKSEIETDNKSEQQVDDRIEIEENSLETKKEKILNSSEKIVEYSEMIKEKSEEINPDFFKKVSQEFDYLYDEYNSLSQDDQSSVNELIEREIGLSYDDMIISSYTDFGILLKSNYSEEDYERLYRKYTGYENVDVDLSEINVIEIINTMDDVKSYYKISDIETIYGKPSHVGRRTFNDFLQDLKYDNYPNNNGSMSFVFIADSYKDIDNVAINSVEFSFAERYLSKNLFDYLCNNVSSEKGTPIEDVIDGQIREIRWKEYSLRTNVSDYSWIYLKKIF